MARSAQTKKRQRSAARSAAAAKPAPAATATGWLTPSPALYWKIAGAACIFIAAVVSMWPLTNGKFYLDDYTYIVNNHLLDEPDRLWKAWFLPGSFIEYYPIEQSMQYFEYLCFGKEPFGYEMVNLLLHGINAIVIWVFLAKLRLRFAWLGGLIYAVYPLSVESVGYISEFKNTLSLAPFVACMWLTVDFERDGNKRSYWPSFYLFVVAMMCKITPMCYPLILLLYAWYLRGKITKRDLRRCAPFAVTSAILCAISLHAGDIYNAGIHDVPPGPIPIGGPLSRTALAGSIAAFNLAHVLVPFRPMLVYPLWKVDPPTVAEYLLWPLLGFVAWVLWRKRGSWGRPVILALGAFFIFQLPNLGLHNISYMCLTWTSDHFFYIPVIFIIALGLAALADIHGKLPVAARPWLFVLPGAAIIAMAVQSFIYAGLFTDHLRLFSYEEKYNPGSWYVHDSLGMELLGKGRVAEAMPELETSLQINPNFAVPHAALAECYFHQGNYPAAEHHYREVLRIDPYVAAGYVGLGTVLAKQNRFEEARQVFLDALKHLSSPTSDLYNYLGGTEAQLGLKDDAIAHFRTALQLDPNDSYAQDAISQLNPK